MRSGSCHAPQVVRLLHWKPAKPFDDELIQNKPSSIFLYKSTIETVDKGEKYVQNWQKTLERRQWRGSGVLLLTLNIFHIFS